jgi:hypothetical protein
MTLASSSSLQPTPSQTSLAGVSGGGGTRQVCAIGSYHGAPGEHAVRRYSKLDGCPFAIDAKAEFGPVAPYRPAGFLFDIRSSAERSPFASFAASSFAQKCMKYSRGFSSSM